MTPENMICRVHEAEKKKKKKCLNREVLTIVLRAELSPLDTADKTSRRYNAWCENHNCV